VGDYLAAAGSDELFQGYKQSLDGGAGLGFVGGFQRKSGFQERVR
jgi:hypothetical protein